MTDEPNHQQLPLTVVPGSPNPGSTSGSSPRRVRKSHSRERREARPSWRMSDQARRAGVEGVAKARRELQRVRDIPAESNTQLSPTAA
jgi:hypothetical protein